MRCGFLVFVSWATLLCGHLTVASELLTLKLPGWISSVAFSPDGKWLGAACSDGTAQVLDANSGQVKSALKGHNDSVAAIAFSPDGRVAATGGFDHTARLWDVNS